jgi:hypothetical protein
MGAQVFSQFTRSGFAAIVTSLMLMGSAAADQWHIAQSSGAIWVGSDVAQLASLGTATDIPGGATVMTGDGARALLVRGTQTMLVGPNAVVIVPDGDSAGITTILQRAGEVTFDVDRQKVKHFAVETPFLAAVVKGTNFTVRIDDDGAALSVARGLVEVTDLATGEWVDAPAGQSAEVSGPAGKFTVSGSGQVAVITPGAPRAPRVEPLSRVKVRALEVTAMNSSTGMTPRLTTIAGDADVKVAGLGIAAAGSGGSNDGGSGGPGAGTTGDGGGGQITVATGGGGSSSGAMPGTFRFGAFGNGLTSWFAGDAVNPFTFVMMIAASAALALGLAYLKGRFS